MAPVIVCDTNVWYKRLPSTLAEGGKLVATYINVFELAQASDWKGRDLHSVRLACRAVIEHSTEMRMDNPWARIAAASDMFFERADPYGCEDRLTFIEHIANGAEFTLDGQERLKGKVHVRKNGLTSLAQEFTQAVQSIRETGAALGVTRSRVQLDVLMGLLSRMMSAWAQEPIDQDDINWEEIDLFIKTLRQYVFEEPQLKSTAGANDIGDLLNLLYVRPGEKYWTFESNVNRIIAGAGMNEYIYYPQSLTVKVNG